MARPRKNETVNEEITMASAEEQTKKRRGRPPKSETVSTGIEIKNEIENSVTEEKKVSEEMKEDRKPPVKRKRRTKAEMAAAAAKEAKEKEQTVKRRCKKKIEIQKEIKTIVQYEGRQIEEKEMLSKVESAWKAEGNTAEIESVIMYVKPQDGKIYYVINGLCGDVDLF